MKKARIYLHERIADYDKYGLSPSPAFSADYGKELILYYGDVIFKRHSDKLFTALQRHINARLTPIEIL